MRLFIFVLIAIIAKFNFGDAQTTVNPCLFTATAQTGTAGTTGTAETTGAAGTTGTAATGTRIPTTIALSACAAYLLGLNPGVTVPPNVPRPAGQVFSNPTENLDSEIAMAVKIFPPMTSDQVAALSTRIAIVARFDTVTPEQWRANCQLAMSYYNWLQRVFVQFNDSLVTFSRLRPMLSCKQDCNFRELLTRNFTNNGSAFAQTVMTLLPPTVIPECRITLKEYLRDFSKEVFTGTSLLSAVSGGLPLSAVATPVQLAQMSPADVLSVLSSLNNTGLDDRSRRGLGAAILPTSNVLLSQISSIITAVPTDLIKNAPVSDIIGNLASFTQNTLDPQLKAVIASKVLSANNASVLASFVANANADLLRTLPLRSLQASGVTIPLASQPPAMLASSSVTLIQSGIKNLASASLGAIVNFVKGSDVDSLSNSDKVSTVVNICSASSSTGNQLTTTQRRSFLSSINAGLKSTTGSASVDSQYSSLSSTQLSSITPLLIDSPESAVNTLSSSTIFTNITTSLASISSSQCSSYLQTSRKTWAKYITTGISKSKTFAGSDLDLLGSCFATSIPTTTLSALNASDWFARISYFQGIHYQPDSTQAKAISQHIATLISRTSASDLDALYVALKDLIIFVPTISSIPCSTLTTYGSSLVSAAYMFKDPSNKTIAQSRLGVDDDSYISSQLRSFVSRFGECVAASSATGRRKRQTTTLTCSQISSSSPSTHPTDVYSATLLKTVSSADFQSCISYFGDSTNSYSSDQLSALASLVTNAYGSDLSKVSDTNIGKINAALLGVSASSLSAIKFTSYGTIKNLGTLTQWSSDQLTSLATAVKASMGTLDANLVSNMGNIICGLSASDLSGISSTIFGNTQSAFSALTAANCPAINNIYNQAKSYSLITPTVSSLLDWSYASGGISTSDIATLSGESISQLPSAAFTAMPAATVNSLSVDQLKKLTADQVSTLYKSSNYAQFSAQVTSALKALSSNAEVTVVLSGSIKTSSVNLPVIILSSIIVLMGYYMK